MAAIVLFLLTILSIISPTFESFLARVPRGAGCDIWGICF
jgi:hypothetical protein